MYTSEQAVVAAIQELGTGWTVFPYDEPERGLLGYCVSRPKSTQAPFKDWEDHVFQWPIFGQDLKPEAEVIEASALVAFIRNEPADVLYLCDDPRKLLLGFVSYRSASEGRSVVRQARLTGVKGLPHEDHAFLKAERERRLAQSEERVTKARAISGALQHKPGWQLRTWYFEIAFVALVLGAVAALTGGLLAWIAALAGLCTFGHANVASRLEERERGRSTPEVECRAWLGRYWVAKELCWLTVFAMTKTWPAVAVSLLMAVFPLWRRLYRKHRPLNRA